MRILIISDSYPPLIGGATRSTQLVAEAMVARGHTVEVVTAWQHGIAQDETTGGVRIHRLRDLTSRMPWFSSDEHRHTPPPFPDPEAVWRIRRLLRRIQPDAIYAYGWLTYSCAVAMGRSRVPLILVARDYGNICPKRTLVRAGRVCNGPAPVKCLRCAGSFYGPVKGTLATSGVLGGRPLLRRRMRGLQSCSRYVQDHMNRFLLGPRVTGGWRTMGMPNLVVPDFRVRDEHPIVDETILAQLPREPYILFVGALRQIKGIQQLLAAYQQLVSPPPLVLIGTRAPDSPSTFPSGVHVIYGAPHATVMAAWDRSLFGVAPSILPEPLGNVIHEGMSRKKAMIGTTPGGHADMIVDGETGLLVPAGDTVALTTAMRRLIEDGDFRTRLGTAAEAKSREFTAEVVLPEIERLLVSVTSSGRY